MAEPGTDDEFDVAPHLLEAQAAFNSAQPLLFEMEARALSKINRGEMTRNEIVAFTRDIWFAGFMTARRFDPLKPEDVGAR